MVDADLHNLEFLFSSQILLCLLRSVAHTFRCLISISYVAMTIAILIAVMSNEDVRSSTEPRQYCFIIVYSTLLLKLVLNGMFSSLCQWEYESTRVTKVFNSKEIRILLFGYFQLYWSVPTKDMTTLTLDQVKCRAYFRNNFMIHLWLKAIPCSLIEELKWEIFVSKPLFKKCQVLWIYLDFSWD